MDRVFTPQQASLTLPLVKKVVADILARGAEYRELALQRDLSVEQQDRAAMLAGELRTLFEEMEGIGCSFRCPNFAYGLVDFPGIIDGELVHLCWKDDEPELLYYHGPTAGFAGRKRIPQELLI